MTSTATAVRALDAGATDELSHIYCCDETRGLCGTNLTGYDEAADVTCVVCLDIDAADAPCGPACTWAVTA